MSNKTVKVEIVDIPGGVGLQIGKKIVRKIVEIDGNFEVLDANDKHLLTVKTYAAAEEEAVRSYNLSI